MAEQPAGYRCSWSSDVHPHSHDPVNPEPHLDVAAVTAAAAVRAAIHAAVGVSPAAAAAAAAGPAQGQHSHAAALVAVKPAAQRPISTAHGRTAQPSSSEHRWR